MPFPGGLELPTFCPLGSGYTAQITQTGCGVGQIVSSDRGGYDVTAVADTSDPAERLRRFARLHLTGLGRDRNLAIVFQVELRQSTKFMERFSSTFLRDYLGMIREAIEDGQRTRLFRADVKATVAAKVFFGVLDEMATNWILSRRRYALETDADTVVELFVNGARAR